MIHQPHTLLLATLHLVHLNETYFRWTTFKLSEVCNWLFLIRIDFIVCFPNVIARRYQHSLTWVSPFERPMSEKIEGRKYRLESQNFIFPTLLSLVCLFVSWASQSTVGQKHGAWNPLRMTNQLRMVDPSSIPVPEARQNLSHANLMRLINLVCYHWIGAPGDV